MFDRFRLSTLSLALLAVPFIGCGSSTTIDSIVVTPTAVSLSGVGATTQLTATASIGHGSHPATQQDVTSQVTWSSGSANVATVSAAGLVTSVGPGSIQVTASINGFTGIITSSATVTVTSTTTGGGTGGTAEPVASLAIIPSAQSVASPGNTSQFIAIGTTPGGTTENLTNQVVWSSSEAGVGTIGATTGLATGVSQGTTTITAIWTNPDTTVVTGTATFTVIGGVPEPITALSINPSAETLSASQTGQFIALGTSGTTGLKQDVTNSAQIAWTSNIPSVATVSGGLATGVSPGTATITAVWTNPDSSVVTASANVTVSASAAPEPLLSINIVPSDTTVWDQSQTQQYLAFGTYSTAPTVRDLTNLVTWISLDQQIASINSGGATGATGGLATAIGYTGTGVIYAEATNPDGTVVLSNPVTFTCEDPNTTPPQCVPGPAPVQLATLTVYNAGQNTTNWLVTAPSSTHVADLIHCGPGSTSGGSVCVGTYPAGSVVTLTESGTGFGGWSANCDTTPNVPDTAPTCTVTLSGNASVGAIFN